MVVVVVVEGGTPFWGDGSMFGSQGRASHPLSFPLPFSGSWHGFFPSHCPVWMSSNPGFRLGVVVAAGMVPVSNHDEELEAKESHDPGGFHA